MIEHSAATIPWMFATGNHEAELFSAQVAAGPATVDAYGPLGYGGLAKRLDLPTTGPSACPSVYSFSYGNVGIVSLDANELCWEFQGLTGYSGGAQVAWLEERLAAWRGDPKIDFIVAFYHECAFSTCNGHSSDGGVRSKLAPLFSRYQVDLAVQGHNHVYERTNPLIYDPQTNSARSGRQAVAVSPDAAGRGRASQRRHHLRGGGHRRGRPATAGRAPAPPTATSPPDRAAGRRWPGTPQPRRGHGSPNMISAKPTRPLTGPRRGTTTTAS